MHDPSQPSRPTVVTDPDTDTDERVPMPNWRRSTLILAVAVAALAAALLVTVTTHDQDQPAASSIPAEGSPEAGFARDMQAHHAQAVEMALIVRDQTTDPIVRAIAYDVATGQQQQIGQMFAWLEIWGLSQTGADEPMAWMAEQMDQMMQEPGGQHSKEMSSMTLQPDGQMPGMASDEDLARLRSLEGVEAEKLFLSLMLRHHEAGVVMAESAVALTSLPVVERFAQKVADAQQAEIEQMLQLQQNPATTTDGG